MGTGIIRISPELLLSKFLLLEGYEVVDARLEGLGRTLELVVISDKLAEGGVVDIVPVYQKADYKLVDEGIDG